jgi:site-specific recombinase XerD
MSNGAGVGSKAPTTKQQGSTENQMQAEALTELLTAAGLEPSDFLTALQAVAEAKKATQKSPEKEKNIYKEKELVYDDENAFIYRRGDTSGKIYYLRIYDKQRKKPYIKSLGTTDRIKAITTARLIYQDIKGKISRGERLKAITTEELVSLYTDKLRGKITEIPKKGITPGTFKLKQYFLKKWIEYINHLGHTKTPIDRIPPERTRDYATWFLNQPKQDGTARSIEQINNSITEIRKAYKDIAVRDKYISSEQIPEIDRLLEQPDEAYKRDILELEQYDRLWKFMFYDWIKEQDISTEEKLKRIIFYNTVIILYRTGLRPKEMLGLKVMEITRNEADSPELQKTHLKIKVRKENSKTGISRIIVAPIKKEIERIKAAYKEMGVPHEPQDYLLFNPHSKERKQYTRQSLYQRLQQVLEKSGLKEELKAEGKKVSLYSSRHSFITWKLRHGNVPIHLVAKLAGTSIDKIEKTYGHIEIERQTELLTRNQGYARSAEVELETHFEAEGIIFMPELDIREERANRQRTIL